jgi:hypothetical protein
VADSHIEMHRSPIPNIAGANPRPNRPGPKVPDDVAKQSKRYLEVRNHAIDLKSKAAELELAVRRGTLVEKKLIEAQATYLLIAMRQKLLNLGSSHAHKFIGLTDLNQCRQILREIGLSVLNEIKNLPLAVSDPNWLETLERDEGK